MKFLGLGNEALGAWVGRIRLPHTGSFFAQTGCGNSTVVSCPLSGAWQAVAGRMSGSIGHSLLRVSGFIGSGLSGRFVSTQMLLRAGVVPGILRFIQENIRGFKRLPPNKSFQGTPLRSAPELSR